MGVEKGNINPPLKLAVAAIFGALAAAVTIAFVLPIPATGGYFNLGDAIIFVAALVFGPFVGAFAGGSVAIADILVGAGQFAPGTLIVKGLEGAIVGFLYRKLHNVTNPGLSASVSVILGGLEMVLGYFIYEQLFLGYNQPAALAELPFNLFQMIIGLIIAVPIMYAVQRVFPQLKS
ncbi:MAG TPA: ECF transporter S component [Candidatus Bathyarchaeia archaeon]